MQRPHFLNHPAPLTKCIAWLKDIFANADAKRENKKAEIVRGMQDKKAEQCPYKIEV